MITVSPGIPPELDPGFVPAVLWNRAYQHTVERTAGTRELTIQVERDGGAAWTYSVRLLPPLAGFEGDTLRYVERLVKFLLWAWGGATIRLAGAPDVADQLKRIYSSSGERKFDYEFMGNSCFGAPINIVSVDHIEHRESVLPEDSLLTQISGNRIGFDLGGSDRKCAAIIDGKVVYSGEVKWNPYFESNPEYHYQGILECLQMAAKHLPAVDAIGGSAAGIYIDNEPRVGSLYRGVSRQDFDSQIRNIFKRLQAHFNGVPFRVENDGDVTALAGARMVNGFPVLGISMGTSLAAGYVNERGSLTGWLNELAFVPVDYRRDAPVDEWSGDAGCGAQYFSQQAVARLLDSSGIQTGSKMTLPERLEWVQDRMSAGDDRIPGLYRTIGTYFGYTIPYLAEFYSLKHLLILGRVTSGPGGELILDQARKVLDAEFPEISRQVIFQIPDETTKRHGQAIAAASLPKL